MSFIENYDFVARGGGRVADHLAQFTNLIDTAIGGGVDFEDVERSAGGDFFAGVTGIIGLGGGTFGAVESFRENASSRRFADTANAGENVGVRDAIGCDGVGECFRDVLLADHVGEGLGPVFSRDDFIAHSES